MNPLFCYGTLQVPEVIRAVTGQTFAGQQATLQGYAIYRVKDAEYPGIVRSDNDDVGGILYKNVADKSMKVLDLFEGDLYRRQLQCVETVDGMISKAWCYVIRDENKGLLTADTWRLADFLANGLESFMAGYVRGRQHIYSAP